MLQQINKVLEEYQQDGYVLTLRQLYYQLVTKNLIRNLDKEYKKLGHLLKEGRMAGLVDWEAIEDRLRVPYLQYHVDDVEAALQDTIDQYKLDRMKGQSVYIEVWVEKDALSSVLKRVTDHYGVKLMVNRGYSSASAMHDAYMRFQRAMDNEQQVRVLYLGDHDPSGLDMIRDIRARILEFMGLEGLEYTDEKEDFHVVPIALTKEQIEEHNPPTNPAKITDSRAGWYIAEHGGVSWEVDALPPKVLHELLKQQIEERIDVEKFRKCLDQEEKDKERLQDIKEDDVWNRKKT